MLSSTTGIIIAVVYYIFREKLLTFFGQAMNQIISADGSPNYVMFSTLMGAGINIILDPIFIFALTISVIAG